MKTIKVPSNWGNPLIIEINTGEKVVLNAGETVEVADELAAVIENALSNLPKESDKIPIDSAVKAYIDSKSYLEKLTVTNETAKEIYWAGIRGSATYIDDTKCITLGISADIKESSDDWKVIPIFENDEIFDDFVAEAHSDGDSGEEPEYQEISKAELDSLLGELPHYTGTYSNFMRYCGIKWMNGTCVFGYSNAWDLSAILEGIETDEEKQSFLAEVQQSVNEINQMLQNLSYDSISIIRKVENLSIKERTVSLNV